MAGVWLQYGQDLGNARVEHVESATDFAINFVIFMLFLLSKGEFLSPFATFLTLCDFDSLFFCNFEAYFL